MSKRSNIQLLSQKFSLHLLLVLQSLIYFSIFKHYLKLIKLALYIFTYQKIKRFCSEKKFDFFFILCVVPLRKRYACHKVLTGPLSCAFVVHIMRWLAVYLLLCLLTQVVLVLLCLHSYYFFHVLNWYPKNGWTNVPLKIHSFYNYIEQKVRVNKFQIYEYKHIKYIQNVKF